MVKILALKFLKTFFSIVNILNFTLSLPINDSSNSSNITEVISNSSSNFAWSSLHRNIKSSDIIYLPRNEYDCSKLFDTLSKGTETENNIYFCQCPPNAPIFNPEYNKCIDRLDNECDNEITYTVSNDFDSTYLPVLNLPRKGNIFLNENKVKWKENGILITPNKNPCKILSVKSLDSLSNWKNIDSDIFTFVNNKNNLKIIWNGLPKEGRMIEGSIVKLKLNCPNSTKTDYCMPFRVQGYQFSGISDIDISTFNLLRTSIIIIIMLLIVLLSGIFTSVTLWLICWKRKKNKIISSLQLQFLQHIKQEKERTAVDVAKYRAAIAAAQNGDINGRNNCYNTYNDKNSDLSLMYKSDNTQQLVNGQNSIIQQKRKLYFSTEYFEPHNMAHPSESAEQFLVELRKMIDNAKKRIKSQKHIPSLFSIPEEPLDFEDELQEIITDMKEEVVSSSSTNSPKSTKSSDSGRESMKDSGSNNGSPTLSPVLKKKETSYTTTTNFVESPSNGDQVTNIKKMVKPSLSNSKNVANLIGAFEQKKDENIKKNINEKFLQNKEKISNSIEKKCIQPSTKGISKIPKPSDKSIAVSPKLSQRKLIPMESVQIEQNETNNSCETPKLIRNKNLNNINDKNNPPISKIPGLFLTNSPVKCRHNNSYSIISTSSEAMRKKSLPRKSKRPSVVCRENLREQLLNETANIPPTATKINSNGVIETNM